VQAADMLYLTRTKFEQLKKQKAKKGPAKKKDDEKTEATDSKPTKKAKDEAKDEPQEDNKEEDKDNDDTADDLDEEEMSLKVEKNANSKPSHTRQPSVSQQSRLRSSSFRAGLKDGPLSPTVKSPSSGPMSPAADAADVYRKQAQRIEELEKENKTLQDDVSKLRSLEEEVQELRESNSDAAVFKAKADEAEKLKAEVASLQRQNTQLNQQIGSKKSRQESTSSPDASLKAELASKSTTIESLELEISSLNARLSSRELTCNVQGDRISELEAQLEKAEAASSAAVQELTDFKTNLASKSKSSPGTATDPRVSELEASLSAAKRATTEAEARAERLDQKITTLNTLHREAESRHGSTISDAQKWERESKELRTRITALQTETSRLRDEAARKARIEASGDADGLDELEDEERIKLSNRIRELEDENFDLRRGVWRDARKNMQPGPDGEDNAGNGFDDVDLSASTRDIGGRPTSPRQRTHSTFADVINSGINAFTAAPTRARKQSLNLLAGDVDEFGDDDDFAFDEDAFRKAHEEEAKARLERVREVKRGLTKWQGWRVDLADLRAGMGGVFDV
jgi:DNA repair exonuclease SbcCD ATPase subunit